MATRTYRNITDDELFVQHLGVSVKPDGLVEVPLDEDEKAREWPDTVWERVSTAKKSTTKDEE